MDKELFVAIMAGGQGERFWPLSRQARPKQFLRLFGVSTLIEQTVLRLHGIVDDAHILIITNAAYKDEIRRILPDIPAENIICEPCAKNTAPCVALASGVVKAKSVSANPVLIMLPSDHYIQNSSVMRRDLAAAVDAGVTYGKLLTIGITPDHPSPEYGYIQCGEAVAENICNVEKFLEKPSVAKAEQLLASGNYLWNAGMFVFPLSTLHAEFAIHAPQLLTLAENIAAAFGTPDFEKILAAEFNAAEKISIDYALMEKSSNIMLRKAAFDWEDVGNWSAIKKYLTADECNNAANGKTVMLDCRNSMIFCDPEADDDQLVAAIGLSETTVIKTADAILIAPNGELGKLRQLLAELRKEEKFLKHL